MWHPLFPLYPHSQSSHHREKSGWSSNIHPCNTSPVLSSFFMGLEITSRIICFIPSPNAKERADTLALLEDERNGCLFPVNRKRSQLPLHFKGTFTVKTGTSLRTVQFILCGLMALCVSQWVKCSLLGSPFPEGMASLPQTLLRGLALIGEKGTENLVNRPPVTEQQAHVLLILIFAIYKDILGEFKLQMSFGFLVLGDAQDIAFLGHLGEYRDIAYPYFHLCTLLVFLFVCLFSEPMAFRFYWLLCLLEWTVLMVWWLTFFACHRRWRFLSFSTPFSC